MSVLINMEMPTSCRDCHFCNSQADTDYGVCAWCDVDGKARDAYTMQDCPLVPVPPHGRLISADLLKADFTGNFIEAYPTALVHAMIDDSPTIIPASEEGE